MCLTEPISVTYIYNYYIALLRSLLGALRSLLDQCNAVCPITYMYNYMCVCVYVCMCVCVYVCIAL